MPRLYQLIRDSPALRKLPTQGELIHQLLNRNEGQRVVLPHEVKTPAEESLLERLSDFLAAADPATRRFLIEDCLGGDSQLAEEFAHDRQILLPDPTQTTELLISPTGYKRLHAVQIYLQHRMTELAQILADGPASRRRRGAYQVKGELKQPETLVIVPNQPKEK